MRRIVWFFICVSIAAQALFSQPRPPRPAPEFPGIALSSYRGDVVLLAFIVTTCTHCQRASGVFQQLQNEFGSRGLRVIEVAFDEKADTAGFAKRFGLSFPVSRSPRKNVMAFLGLPADARLGTPQVVLIDRIGMIRAQSAREGSPMLQTKDVLESLIASMLRRTAIQ
ncbi:MAG TPA: TlpA disulfide reductase family protein [Bryobacteraceae bacterium]|nr:TlpA disulfide reductase family protein [Bryobacteraceae bacterium]